METLYSEKVVKELKKILKKPEGFDSLSIKKKKYIQSRIKKLFILTDNSIIFNDNKNIIKEILNELKIKGEKDFYTFLKKKLSGKKKKGKSADISNQFRLLIEASLKTLFPDRIEDVEKTYNDILENIEYEEILFICLSSALSCLETKNYYEIEKVEKYDIESSRFFYNLRENLLKFVFLKVSNIIEKDESLIINSMKKIKKISNLKDFNCLNNFTKQIEKIFIFHLDLKVVTLKGVRKETTKNYFSIPKKIVDSCIVSSHLPEIMENSETEFNKLEIISKIYKVISNGVSDVKLSKFAIDVIDKSRKKKFIINNNCIKLFELIDEYSDDDVFGKFSDFLPFTPLSILKNIEKKIMKLEENKDENEKIKSWIKNFYKNNNVKTTLENVLVKMSEFNDKNIINYLEYYNLKKDYKKRCNLRIIHNTIIQIGKIYLGFPIFFINSIDYRTRMYPWSWLFSRTTGKYKYMLNDYNKKKLTKEGLKNMISSYYFNFKNKRSEFKIFSDENFNSDDYHFKVKNFFKIVGKNEIEKKKSFFYLKLLEMEIKEVFENGFLTNFMIEIDQKSSSAVFLSLVTGNELLAIKSNLLGGEPSDTALYLMEKSEEFFSKYKEIEKDDLVKLCSSRKIHKYLFMCYCYNESSFGRIERMKSYNFSYESSKIISINYSDFINHCFPGLDDQIKKINSIVKFVMSKKVDRIELNTIDGCKLLWQIFSINNTSLNKKKFKDPVKESFVSYHINTYDTNKINKKKMITSFIPNYIHSFDAGVMRIIIEGVYRKSGYIINHLHDSIQCHPNNLDDVYSVISDIYSGIDNHEFLRRSFIDPMRNLLLEEDYYEFDNLVKSFLENNKKIIIKKSEFNPINMYPFE